MDITGYIKYYTNIVPADLCERIVNKNFIYEPSSYSTHDSGKIVKENRVSSEDVWIRKDHQFYQELHTCYNESIKHYREDFPDFNVQHLTDFRISKYTVGGFMSEHTDNIHHSHGQKWGYPQVTVLLFMNDDYEGGEIVIANKRFWTSKGSAIVFPSNFMFPHEVLQVTEGERYSVTCWLM